MGKQVEPEDGRSQAEKFEEAARELGAENDPARFDEVMRRLAQKPPEPRRKDGPKGG